MPRFIDDSNYETEADPVIPKKRRRIAPRRLDSSSDEDLPVRKQVKAVIPPPPPVSSSNQSKKGARKGQGPSKDEVKKKQKEELMERLKIARAAAASKMATPKSSWEVTPTKASKNTASVSDIFLFQLKFSQEWWFNIIHGYRPRILLNLTLRLLMTQFLAPHSLSLISWTWVIFLMLIYLKMVTPLM